MSITHRGSAVASYRHVACTAVRWMYGHLPYGRGTPPCGYPDMPHCPLLDPVVTGRLFVTVRLFPAGLMKVYQLLIKTVRNSKNLQLLTSVHTSHHTSVLVGTMLFYRGLRTVYGRFVNNVINPTLYGRCTPALGLPVSPVFMRCLYPG